MAHRLTNAEYKELNHASISDLTHDQLFSMLITLGALALEVVEDWNVLSGWHAHPVGCECGGVAWKDSLRIDKGDFTNLHTCARLTKDVALLKEALDG